MNSNLNKYIALPLKKVKPKLNENYSLILVENKPPRQNKGEGQKRIININQVDPNVIEIIWSYEDYVDKFYQK